MGDVPVCGDSMCEGSESSVNCCEDCGCPQDFGCEAGECIALVKCGNGTIDAGEQCDGANLNGTTCGSQGFDGGNLSCTGGCAFDTSGCCSDECAGGDTCLNSTTVQSCGNFDGDACLDLGNSKSCSDGQSCSGGSCGCNSGEFQLLSELYPNFGAPGCSGDGSLRLKAAGELASPTKLRVHVRKEDDSSFNTASTLTLYTGEPIQCPNPPNVSKATKSLVVGQVDQTIDLTLNPYNGGWTLGEIKKFWVGKDEGGYNAFRATGLVSVKRICIP